MKATATPKRQYAGGWYALLILLLNSCSLDYPEDECCFNTEITYRYYHRGVVEALTDSYLGRGYMGSMTHLVFCDNIIVGKIEITDKHASIDGEIADNNRPEDQSLRQLRLNFAPGSYTIDSWGNMGSEASLLAPFQYGKTTRTGLSHLHTGTNNNVPVNPSLNNSNPLFYGSIQFEVVKGGRIVQYVDMLAAHAQLSVTVKWAKDGERPLPTDKLVLYLENLPAGHLFDHEHAIALTAPGTPRYGGKAIMLHVPRRIDNTARIAQTTSLSFAQAQAVFLSLRYSSDTHPVLRIFGGANGDKPLFTKDGMEKTIDLKRLFDVMTVDMNNHLWQYFDIEVLIDGSTATVTEVTASIDDWQEGGNMKW